MVHKSTVQSSTFKVQYSTVQYSTLQYSTVQSHRYLCTSVCSGDLPTEPSTETGPCSLPSLQVTPYLLHMSTPLQSIQETSTLGIEVQQTSIPGVDDVSIWEFSGLDCYYMIYDHFIGNTNCIHVVLYSAADPPAVQLQQVTFWLSFLQARIPPVEPLGDCGRSHKPAHVMLVATHGDLARSRRPDVEEKELRRKVEEKFGWVFNIEESVAVVDAHAASSPGIKVRILTQPGLVLCPGSEGLAGGQEAAAD